MFPVIDFSNPNKEELKEQLLKAGTDTGFFFAKVHSVPQPLISKMFQIVMFSALILQQSREFFVLPEEEKMQWLSVRNIGYVPNKGELLDPEKQKEGDLKE